MAVKDQKIDDEHDIFEKLDDLVLGDLKLLPHNNLKIIETISQHMHDKFVKKKKINKVIMMTTNDDEED